VLKNPISILGLASIVTSVAVWSAEPQAVTASGASQARLAAAAHNCRPLPGETKFGPYGTEHEAKQKCRSLERDGWRNCRIQKCYECQVWYVFGRRNNF
jgi:hypothetical protein